MLSNKGCGDDILSNNFIDNIFYDNNSNKVVYILSSR